MEPKPNDLVTCPYNKSHQVEHYRMQIHLQKCRKQYPNSKKVTCPFDATHIMNEAELEFHVQKCPKRSMMDTELFVVQSPRRNVKPVASTNDTVEDDWSNEPNVSAYMPDYSQKGNHIIKKIKGATPSERRKARMEGIKNYRAPEEDDKQEKK